MTKGSSAQRGQQLLRPGHTREGGTRKAKNRSQTRNKQSDDRSRLALIAARISEKNEAISSHKKGSANPRYRDMSGVIGPSSQEAQLSDEGDCRGRAAVVMSRFGTPFTPVYGCSNYIQKRGLVREQVTVPGGWGRRPKGDAPRSEAGALGARWRCQLDPSHPPDAVYTGVRMLELHPKTATSSNFLDCPTRLGGGMARSARRCSITRSDVTRARPGHPSTELQGCTESATSNSTDCSLSHVADECWVLRAESQELTDLSSFILPPCAGSKVACLCFEDLVTIETTSRHSRGLTDDGPTDKLEITLMVGEAFFPWQGRPGRIARRRSAGLVRERVEVDSWR
jgi:hypothetical protein